MKSEREVLEAFISMRCVGLHEIVICLQES